MIWFNRLFPPFMVLFPLVFVLCTRAHPKRARDDAPRRMQRLWLVTLIALALHLVVQPWLESNPGSLEVLRRAWPLVLGTGGFMMIWFAFAMPALQAKHPGWRNLPNQGSPEPVRSASLTPRNTTSPISRGTWIMGWTLFGLCTGAIGWAITEGAPSVLLLSIAWWLGFSVYGSRASQVEAEPMDAAGSPELAEAWASLRSFKAWCFFSIGLLAMLGFAAVAVVTVYAPQSAGMSGAVLGTAGGIAGGVFGTVASIRRARINALLQELGEREGNGSAHVA
jgi:hypothetical protein